MTCLAVSGRIRGFRPTGCRERAFFHDKFNGNGHYPLPALRQLLEPQLKDLFGFPFCLRESPTESDTTGKIRKIDLITAFLVRLEDGVIGQCRL